MIQLVFFNYTIFDTIFRNNEINMYEGFVQMLLFKNCSFYLLLTL